MGGRTLICTKPSLYHLKFGILPNHRGTLDKRLPRAPGPELRPNANFLFLPTTKNILYKWKKQKIIINKASLFLFSATLLTLHLLSCGIIPIHRYCHAKYFPIYFQPFFFYILFFLQFLLFIFFFFCHSYIFSLLKKLLSLLLFV